MPIRRTNIRCLLLIACPIACTAAWAWTPLPPVPAAPHRGTAGQAGQARKNPKDGLDYVWIPPGKFTMGCSTGDTKCQDEEKPAHKVTITRGFWLGRTEVTGAAFQKFAKATHRENEGGDDSSMPVLRANWNDATHYCEWAGMRLPTEAEWEFAARANTTEPRYGPLDEVAWYDGNSGGKAHPVGGKRPNPWGLYDMLGNLGEWVSDWFGPYNQNVSTDPAGPERGRYRVVRGGTWLDYGMACRASSRNAFDESDRTDRFGFRCAGQLR